MNNTHCIRIGDDVLNNYGVNINSYTFDFSMFVIIFITLHVAVFIITILRI